MRNWLSTKIKTTFDRRYALGSEVRTLKTEVRRLSQVVASLETKQVSASGPPKGPGDRFVGNEDPVALRKKLFEAHRLAVESALAIETILQEEMRLWQAIDISASKETGLESID